MLLSFVRLEVVTDCQSGQLIFVSVTFFNARCNDELPSVSVKRERHGENVKIEISERLFSSNANSEIAADASFIFQPERNAVIVLLMRKPDKSTLRISGQRRPETDTACRPRSQHGSGVCKLRCNFANELADVIIV